MSAVDTKEPETTDVYTDEELVPPTLPSSRLSQYTQSQRTNNAIVEAALELVKQKVRYKGKPTNQPYAGSWTKAEVALYRQCQEAGLL